MTNDSLAPDGKPFKTITLKNSHNMTISLTDWGATWLSCLVPVEDKLREVLLGCQSISDYLVQDAYLGATVGRYANRIRNASLRLNGKMVQLTANQGPHQLHGGITGFDKKRWSIAKQTDNQVTFELISPDNDQGYPGNVKVQAIYQLTDDNQVVINFHATTDEDTPINIINHAYFNLDGDNQSILNHTLQVHADFYLPVNEQCIPTLGLKPVREDDMDLNHERKIGDNLLDCSARKITKGYDHGYLLNQSPIAAKLTSSDKKLSMEVITTKPALQVYSGNYLGGIKNRTGHPYADYSGIALEASFLADSPNHPEWPQPSCIVTTSKPYHYQTIYRFISI